MTAPVSGCNGGVSEGNRVRYWRHPAVSGVDLMRARFHRHAFARHSHETFCVGVTEVGTENLGFGTGPDLVGPGGLILINPGEVHTGQAAAPGEWGYRALYPTVELISAIADELRIGGGAPAFRERIVYDRQSAAAFVAAHRAAEDGEALESSTLMHTALARLLHRYSGPPRRPTAPAGGHQVAEASAVLRDRMLAPPTLDELAELVGTGKFALLRAFHAVHGLPPFTYLTQLRVRRVRGLLEAGVRPAEAAVAAGFADQAHMSRHFHRMVGIPPGAYRNQVQDSTGRGHLPSLDELPT